MYKIYADKTLIYDSTVEDYKIGKGSITLEVNKSGSFTFSIYPNHFYYDSFVKMKTIITVYKSDKIVFRGRVLNDVSDYHNVKTLTCEGELGFLQDSIIRPYAFSGTPEELFRNLISDYNAHVDDFKRFKIGQVTVTDPNNYIARSNSNYESVSSNLNSRLIEDSLGGYFYVTHGDNGDDPTPTINYISDFTKVATQKIEFGSNLKDYTKTAKAEEIATAIIPLGATLETDNKEDRPRLTIKDVNNGVDYVYNSEAVALRGWIFKVVTWDDVTDPTNLKNKAIAYLNDIINQSITIELKAIDLHLIDKNVESFILGDYIEVVSAPHNFNEVMLCSKLTLDLLKPENDSYTLGYTYSTFTEKNKKVNSKLQYLTNIDKQLNRVNSTVLQTQKDASEALSNYANVQGELNTVSGDLEIVAGVVTDNARNIATNSQNIATNSQNIASLLERLELIEKELNM